MNRKRPLAASIRTISLSLLLMAASVGCTGLRQAVTPIPNREVIALDADAIVAIMHRAGFSDEEILDLGTDLRNSLAQQGAAQIRVGKKTEAIFAVHGTYIHISSRRRNGFLYNTETKEVR